MKRDMEGEGQCRIDVLERLRVAAAEEQAASGLVNQLLAEANELGLPWPAVGRALGTTAEKARWRYRSKVSQAPSLLTRKAGRSNEDLPAPRPSASSGPGVSVAEAAKLLGISRPAIYRRIAAGKLASTLDESGYSRVLLEPPAVE